MKKKIIVIGLGFLVILGGLGYVFKDRFLSFLKPSSSSPDQKFTQKPKEEFNFEWQTWEDAAGFAFEHPKELEIDEHLEDEVNYAYLELKSNEKNGKIVITVNDTEYSNINDWLEQDELVKDGNVLETEIASISARRIKLGDNQEIAAFIDWDQVIYLINSQNEGEEYWRQIYIRILSSFKLIPLEGESAEDFANWLGDFDTSGVDIVEAVEVIE